MATSDFKQNSFTINGIPFQKDALMMMSPVMRNVLQDDTTSDHIDGLGHVTEQTLKLCAYAIKQCAYATNKRSMSDFMMAQSIDELEKLAAFTHRYDISSIHVECDDALAKQCTTRYKV